MQHIEPRVTTQPVVAEALLLLKDLTPQFNYWGTAIKSADVENTFYYLYARKLLDKWGDYTLEEIPVEIRLFLRAIKENTYCPKSSRYKHSYYYPFFYVIFLTGVRNAESIGITGKACKLCP